MINIYGEFSSLLIGLLILFFLFYSNPKKTKGFYINFAGLIFGIIGSVLLFFVGSERNVHQITTSPVVLIAFFSFSLCYIIILNIIFTYIYYLVYGDGEEFKQKSKLSAIVTTLIYAGVGFLYFNVMRGGSQPFLNDADLLEHYISYICSAGLVACVLMFTTFVFNHTRIPKIVLLSGQIFIGAVAVTLFVQLMLPKTIFIGLTYILPFMASYLLFHSNPFDEETGMQSAEPLNTTIAKAIRKNREFAIVYVSVPQLEKTNFLMQESMIHHLLTDVARRTERISSSSHCYRISGSTYAAFTFLDKKMTAFDYFNAVTDIINSPSGYGYFPASYKAIGIGSHPFLSNLDVLQHYYTFLADKLTPTVENEEIFSGTKEITEFMEYYRIHLAIEDIRDKKDLDDSRVLAYAQPIYSVEKEAFLSAEALMRLEIDGKILGPGQFIPIAEANSCIHPLTKIILNKVCKEIRRIQDEYDFDCITVNCSPIELSIKKMTDDLLKIIEQNGVDPSKIRLEVTESSMYQNADVVASNMQSMSDEGITFYLDDFGTGYSNFDRLTSGDFHTIKFDKSVLYKAMEDENTEEMIHALIHMLKESNISPLVEGVETEEQRLFSIKHGFDFIQGFNYAKPVPIDELSAYFKKKDEK